MTPRAPVAALVLLGCTLAALTLCGLGLDLPSFAGAARIPRVDMLVALLMVAVCVYFLAVRLVLRHSMPRGAAWGILGVAVALRLMLLTSPPLLSSDIYRYVWDGRVQAAGINPYRYVPADPALQTLRDSAVYPNINRAGYAHTIYPPVAQMVYAGVARAWDSVLGMRVAMLLFEAIGVACAMALLSMAGRPPAQILIYAWNPLALWSFASDGHVDAIVVGLLGAALLLRARRRDGWAGAVLAGAVLAKFLPLAVAPAFFRRGVAWRPVLAGACVIIGGYALYASAGWQVLGFLPSYGQEEGITAGSGIWLLAGLGMLMPLPPAAPLVYAACVAAGFAALAIMLLRRRAGEDAAAALCHRAGVLAAVATVAVSPHYHWYFAWLALPAAIAPSRALLWLATVPLLLIVEPTPGDRFFWPALIYGPAILLLAADLVRERPLWLRRSIRLGETS